LSNVLAAIGVAQMEVLDQRVERRRKIFDLYAKELGQIDEIRFMPEVPESRGNRWLTTMTLQKSDPYRLITELESENIESRLLWKPMHLQPLFKEAMAVVDGTSEILFEKGICLPSGSSMSDQDVYRVCDVVRKALK
jgi:UDP-N-acetylbacillosamine transaminase